MEHELISRKVKVGNEWQTKTYPVIAGRLRIIHDTNAHLSIATKIVKLEPDFVVVRATLECDEGKFNGTGTASAQRDARLADSLVELAETRSIARCLRFGGVGVEYAGFEEVSHIAGSELEEQNGSKQPCTALGGFFLKGITVAILCPLWVNSTLSTGAITGIGTTFAVLTSSSGGHTLLAASISFCLSGWE